MAVVSALASQAKVRGSIPSYGTSFFSHKYFLSSLSNLRWDSNWTDDPSIWSDFVQWSQANLINAPLKGLVGLSTPALEPELDGISILTVNVEFNWTHHLSLIWKKWSGHGRSGQTVGYAYVECRQCTTLAVQRRKCFSFNQLVFWRYPDLCSIWYGLQLLGTMTPVKVNLCLLELFVPLTECF